MTSFHGALSWEKIQKIITRSKFRIAGVKIIFDINCQTLKIFSIEVSKIFFHGIEGFFSDFFLICGFFVLNLTPMLLLVLLLGLDTVYTLPCLYTT